jgi:hypothetical protein
LKAGKVGGVALTFFLQVLKNIIAIGIVVSLLFESLFPWLMFGAKSQNIADFKAKARMCIASAKLTGDLTN